MKKRSWFIWVLDNIYLPLCFALTLSGFVAVALGQLEFWAVAGPVIVVWVLNLFVWGARNIPETTK